MATQFEKINKALRELIETACVSNQSSQILCELGGALDYIARAEPRWEGPKPEAKED